MSFEREYLRIGFGNKFNSLLVVINLKFKDILGLVNLFLLSGVFKDYSIFLLNYIYLNGFLVFVERCFM